MSIALLRGEALAQARDQLGQGALVAAKIVGVRDVGKPDLCEAGAGIAGDLAERLVDPQPPALTARDCHADRGIIEGRAKALLRLTQDEVGSDPLGDVLKERREHVPVAGLPG